jgi:hypothetical protein
MPALLHRPKPVAAREGNLLALPFLIGRAAPDQDPQTVRADTDDGGGGPRKDTAYENR